MKTRKKLILTLNYSYVYDRNQYFIALSAIHNLWQCKYTGYLKNPIEKDKHVQYTFYSEYSSKIYKSCRYLAQFTSKHVLGGGP